MLSIRDPTPDKDIEDVILTLNNIKMSYIKNKNKMSIKKKQNIKKKYNVENIERITKKSTKKEYKIRAKKKRRTKKE